MTRVETPPPLPLVIYTAVVGLGVERSDLEVSSAAPVAAVAEAVARPPEWTLAPWVPMRDESSTEIERCALQKLKAHLDFGAGISDGSKADIEAAVYRQFDAVGQILH